MAKQNTPHIGECVYCGKTAELTSDHIPPKSLFAKPRPSNLVVVPSCLACNEGASTDDEYFRLMLTLREDTAAHPDVQQILPAVFRSLTKPTKMGFAHSLFQSIREANFVTSSGLFIGRRPAYDVDIARLDRVAQRIIKGLFYSERQLRLPDNYTVFAFSAVGLSSLAKDLKDDLIANIVNPVLLHEPRIIGKHVFTYRVAFAAEDLNLSAWHLIFYEKVVFIGFTTLLLTDGAA